MSVARAELLERVLEVVRARLPAVTAPIEGTTRLRDLPGFDSLAVVAILEQLEDDTGIVLDPELVVPETFESPLALARALLP